MISNLFLDFSTVVTEGTTLVVDVLSQIVPIFWTTTESGGALTFIGSVTIIGVAIPMVGWGLNWVMGLIRSIRLTRSGKK